MQVRDCEIRPPWYYGYSHREWTWDSEVWYPIPLNYITKAYVRISYAWNRFRGQHSKWEKGFWEKVAKEKKKEYLRGKEEVSKRFVTWVTGISRDYLGDCYRLGLGQASRITKKIKERADVLEYSPETSELKSKVYTENRPSAAEISQAVEEAREEIARELDNVNQRFSDRLRSCLKDGRFTLYP